MSRARAVSGGARASTSGGLRAATAAAVGAAELAAARPADRPIGRTRHASAAVRGLQHGGRCGAWEALRAEVSVCTRCELCRGRTQTVFGVGDTTRRAAGDRRGAGRRGGPPGRAVRRSRRAAAQLDAAGHGLSARDRIHRQRAQVPPARQPRSQAGRGRPAACPYLQRQIELLRPRLILAVGRIAAQNLLATETPIGAPARTAASLRRRGDAADRHLPSGLPAAQPRREAQGLGGPEVARAELSSPAARGRGANRRAGWSHREA